MPACGIGERTLSIIACNDPVKNAVEMRGAINITPVISATLKAGGVQAIDFVGIVYDPACGVGEIPVGVKAQDPRIGQIIGGNKINILAVENAALETFCIQIGRRSSVKHLPVRRVGEDTLRIVAHDPAMTARVILIRNKINIAPIKNGSDIAFGIE